MSPTEKRVVLMQDPYNQPKDGPSMEFRLTYQGPLYATQKDPVTGQRDARRDHKHDIRKVFHKQLKRLWQITPHLARGGSGGPPQLLLSSSDELTPKPPIYDQNALAARYPMYNTWNFVPLVTQEPSSNMRD